MSRILYSAVVSAALALAGPVEAQEAAAIPHEEGVVDTVSIIYPPAVEAEDGASSGPIAWTHNVARLDADFIQLEISDRGTNGDASGFVEFWDRNGEVLERLSAADLVRAEGYWTDLFPANSIDIVVRGPDAEGFAFEITGVSHEKSGFRFESIIGADQRRHLREYKGDFLLNNPAAAPAVAKLAFIKQSNSGIAKRFVCTGFLVAADLLVTNEHCVADIETCRKTKALFGYEKTGFGLARATDQFGCQEVLAVDYEHDVALLRLETQPGSPTPGNLYGTLGFSTAKLETGEKLYIIQHPAGEPKQISDLDCAVNEVLVPGRGPRVDLAHTCDTLGGSSGSPVFNDAGEVVGLHHLGKSPSGRFAALNRAVLAEFVVDSLKPHLTQ